VILRRDDELARLADGVEAAARGQGGIVLVVGPAGIGKTALVREARRLAVGRKLRVLGAAASELDREFPFGLVHQLLDTVVAEADSERRERLLAGAAGRAEVVLAPSDGSDLPEDPGHAVVHGLYWLLANLADEAPLVLLVDDLHWADRASLRLLEYLARRIESLPVLVVATLRPTEPGAHADLLLALETAPAAAVVRPHPLDESAVAELLGAAVGGEPEAAFVSACAEATGGNPLLLRVLAAQAAEQGLAGRGAEAAEIARLAAPELGVVVRRRLAGLGDDAIALAHAAAVLGEPSRLDDLAAVAGLPPEAARTAADRLAAADLLEPPGWGFVHPIVRAAVSEGLPPATLTGLHETAARRLRDSGAVPARVAVHLLASEPSGDPEVVEWLRVAARGAAAEGAPETGVVHLRRALAEPPPAGDLPQLLLELGELESRAGDPAGVERLSEALDAGLRDDEAARARAARGALHLHIDPVPALDEFAAALEEATDPTLRLRLEALLLEASVFHVAFAPRRAELLKAGRADPEPSPVMLAHLAQDAAFSGSPSPEVLDLARRANAADALLRAVGPATSTFNLLVHALRTSEHPHAARSLLERGEAFARREGLRFADFFLEHAAAYWHWDYGSVAGGLAYATVGLEKTRDGGFEVTIAALAAIAGELLVENDDVEEAAAVVDALPGGFEEFVGGPFALGARGVVRRRQHRRDDAEADLRAAIEGFEQRGWAHAAAIGPQLHLAELLGEGGDTDAAVDLARAAAAVVERAGTDGMRAAALRVEGLVTGGEDGLELLAEAAERLGESPMLRQRGWALLELGAALRRAGRRADAREPLRMALDVATRIEAARLARLARDELSRSGGRAVRAVLTGPASLTPSERRVADLAAGGLTNREIAESLWVTRKTVELHLGNAYAKLGIRSRSQLAEALGPDPAVAA
jgi:DNA-binding CsgD family transcriptional regulator